MTVEQAVYNIRHAQYGEEVRESIAEGIETIDQDVTAQNLEAEAWAVGTRNGEPVPTTDPAYHNNAKYHAENTDVHQDGNYPEMTVGTAEQLESTVMTEDKTPYIFRTSGGSADIGNREYDTLIGGTVAWNQLQQNNATGGTDAGITATNNGDGSWSVSGTSSSAAWFYCNNSSAYIKIQTGHKYLLRGFPSNSGVFYWKFRNADSTGTSSYADNGAGYILNTDGSFNATIGIGVFADKAITGTATVYPQVFDLTLMFGSAIADYIYSLETANAGAGMAWFRNLFPKPYYAYNAGTLIHVNASAHKTVGFNQWDEEWDVGSISSITGANTSGSYVRSKNYVPVIPGETYYFTRPGTTAQYRWIYAYDKNKNFLDNVFGDKYLTLTANTLNTFTVPNGVYYIRFLIDSQYGTTYKHDICIHLKWSGTRDGEYEPYNAHTYPLDSDLVLRGIPKLDASNNLYYDGDIYVADGTVTRRYGIVDLGSLAWAKDGVSGASFYRFNALLPEKDTSSYTNIICSKYAVETADAGVNQHDKTIKGRGATAALTVRDDSYSDATAFKTAMSGVYLVYELATPTTESADPFASPQIVDDWGTEEYVVTEQSGVAMPVGHNTKYPQNLRDKLQHLPNLASADGYYGIQQTGTQMVLVEPDNALSDTSKNAVQNKVVKAALALKADKTDVEYLKLREEEDRQMILGSVAEVVEDTYDELRSAPIHTSITVGQNVYPRMDNTRLGLETIKGRTVAFNQLVPISALPDTDSNLQNNGNGSLTLLTTLTSDLIKNLKTNASLVSAHVYFTTANHSLYDNSLIGTQGISNTVFKALGTGTVSNDRVYIPSGTAAGLKVYPMLFDLTLMYGSTIADSIYAMEQATPGSGVAYVRQRMPLDYYAYNAGELKAPVVSGVEVTGFNQWDEVTESGAVNPSTGATTSNPARLRSKNFIPVIGGSSYYFCSPKDLEIFQYDANQNYIGALADGRNVMRTLAENCAYLKIAIYSAYGTTYKNNLCINLSDPSRNSEYRPYQHESLSIPSTTLNGVGAAQDYIEAVEVGENDYSLIKHTLMGEVDMGDLNYTYISEYQMFTATLPATPYSATPNAVASKFYGISIAWITSPAWANADMVVSFGTGNDNTLRCKNANYTDPAQFKTAMSGVYCAYELATPTQTTIAEHLTLADVSAIAQNGGIIGIVNANGDIVQPDLTVDTVTGAGLIDTISDIVNSAITAAIGGSY